MSQFPENKSPLKKQQIFEQKVSEEQTLDNTRQDELTQPQVIFDKKLEQQLEQQEQFNELSKPSSADLSEQAIEQRYSEIDNQAFGNSAIDEIEINPTKDQSKSSKLGKWFMLLLLGIVGIETADFLIESWLSSPFMAALYTGALGLGALLAGKTLLAEFKQLKRLKQIDRWQQDSERMTQAEQIGQARTMCGNISASLPATNSQTLATFQQAIKDDFSDDEIIKLYSDMVLSPIDEQAVKLISRHASETSLMVAISPMALMDMALMMWRNFKMIEQICALYGVELGYWSRIKLTKSVFKNVAYAGVSELIADIGAAALSMELAGKMSSRAAQGLGAGLLTGRLGFQVMKLCRPIPACDRKQKRLGDLSKHLLGNIRRALTNSQLKD